MFAQVVPDIVKAYGLEVRRVGAAQKGYRNESYPLTLADGQIVNLIFYKREPHILERVKRADAVAAHAAATLPVRVRHDPRLLRVYDNTYAGVYEYLPGATIAWEAYTKKHLKLLGWAMSDLHAELADAKTDLPQYLLSDELAHLNARMRRYFSSDDVARAVGEKLGVIVPLGVFDMFETLIVRSSRLGGQQYVHMDMVRGNVLFDQAQPADRWQLGDVALTGIIDFEKTAYGQPACDIARTLAFLLVDCPRPAADILTYFLNSGYQKRGRAALVHRELIAPFVRFFLVHDFYKFLRHTPYESLADNYHYVRTRDILHSYGMISTVHK